MNESMPVLKYRNVTCLQLYTKWVVKLRECLLLVNERVIINHFGHYYIYVPICLFIHCISGLCKVYRTSFIFLILLWSITKRVSWFFMADVLSSMINTCDTKICALWRYLYTIGTSYKYLGSTYIVFKRVPCQ